MLASARALVPLINGMWRVASVLDVGCGVGTWLSVFRELGARDVVGVDGPWVTEAMLRIPRENFVAHSLAEPLDLGRRFDTVLCLEVAEHLPAAASDTLVESLVRHGKRIVFSAAIPGQGGTDHVNEQWPSYWIPRFEALGFECVDAFRPLIWNEPDVAYWYRQNLLLFSEAGPSPEPPAVGPPDLVHPEAWLDLLRRAEHRPFWNRVRARVLSLARR